MADGGRTLSLEEAMRFMREKRPFWGMTRIKNWLLKTFDFPPGVTKREVLHRLRVYESRVRTLPPVDPPEPEDEQGMSL